MNPVGLKGEVSVYSTNEKPEVTDQWYSLVVALQRSVFEIYLSPSIQHVHTYIYTGTLSPNKL